MKYIFINLYLNNIYSLTFLFKNLKDTDLFDFEHGPLFLFAYNSNREVNHHSCGEMNFKCEYCESLNFREEKVNGGFRICCHKGKVKLPDIKCPNELIQLLTNNDINSKNYLSNIRQFNNALAFASFNAEIHDKFRM